MLSRLLLGAHNIAVYIYKNSINECWNNITVQPGSFYGSAVERKFELVTEDLELRRTSWHVARHRTPAGFLSLSALITPAEYIAARFIQSGNTLLLIVGMGLANGRHSFLKARILSRDHFRQFSPLCLRLLLWKQVFALWEGWRANCDHAIVLWMIDRSYRNRQSQLDEDAKWSPVHSSPLARQQAPVCGETRFCGT